MTARRRKTDRGPAYCRPEKAAKGLTPRTSPMYCDDADCNFKVRGPNHEDGDHHNGVVKKCRRGRAW